MSCHVEETDAFLHVPIDVFGAVVTGLDARLDEDLVQGVAGNAAGDVQGPGPTPVVVFSQLVALGLLEIGEAVLIVPALSTLLFPSVI